MDLNKPQHFPQLDRQNILAQIDKLPADLEEGWQAGHRQEMPDWQGIRQIVLAGVGTGLLAADMLSGYTAAICPIPIYLQRDGDLPAWVHGEHTLVMAASSSGNSDESLSACQTALKRNCRVLGMGAAGKLAQTAPVFWTMDFSGHPALAVGRLFGMLLSAFHRLSLLPDAQKDLQCAVTAVLKQQEYLKGDSPLSSNPAKRQAGQMMGRWVKIVGSGWMAPVARSWKHHINLLAKAWAQHEVLPEAAHNMVFGLLQPEEQLPRSMVVFLRAPGEPRLDRLRTNMTRKLMMLEGIGTDTYDAVGDTPLAHQWTGLQFGCYTAYYLAMCYQIDPNPAGVVETLQEDLTKHSSR